MTHTSNPSTQESETGGWTVWATMLVEDLCHKTPQISKEKDTGVGGLNIKCRPKDPTQSSSKGLTRQSECLSAECSVAVKAWLRRLYAALMDVLKLHVASPKNKGTL